MASELKWKRAAFYVPIAYDAKMFPLQWRDYAAFFLNTIHWNKICWKANQDGYSQLHSSVLAKIIPNRVLPKIKKALLSAGVIETDGKVVWGKKCMGYRLADECTKTRRIWCTHRSLNRKINQHRKNRTLTHLPVHDWLEEKLSMFRMDKQAAMRIINRLYPDEDSTDSIKNYRTQLKAICQKIEDGEHYLEVDSYGRVHTLLTVLPSELRSCLTIKGEPLVGLDLSNSQPLLAGIFARQYFRNDMAKCRFLNKVFPNAFKNYCIREVEEMARQGTPSIPEDLKEYIQTCERGEFYRSFTEDGQDPRVVKRRFWASVFFGRNEWKTPLRFQFEEKYPSMSLVLKELKKKDYRRAAWVLQNYESTLFIGIICNEIKNERPHTPLLTIHDSLLTTRNNVQYVKERILKTFNRLGVNPILHEEIYDAKQFV